MNKRLLPVTLIVAAGIMPMSAATSRLFGVVTDSITGERLPFANILSSKNPKENSVADENGNFRIFTTGATDGWTVGYSGYELKPIVFDNADTLVNIRLVPMAMDLTEVVVKPKKEKYSKRNNPAVEFVKRLRRSSKENDPMREPFYSYDKYEKTLIATNNFNGDFSSGFLSEGGKFLQNYVDTSSYTGKRLLDLMIKEKASTKIKSRDPRADKEITRGYRSSCIDEVWNREYPGCA